MRRKIFVSLLLIVLLLSGCGGGWVYYHNKKADDAISHAIYEELGKRVFYYGKRDSYKNITISFERKAVTYYMGWQSQ